VHLRPLQIEVGSGAAPHQRGLHGCTRIGHPYHGVVHDLAERAAHHHPAGAQRIPPLVVREVVQGRTGPAEVQEGEGGDGVLGGEVVGPAAGGQRVGERGGEGAGRHRRGPEADAQCVPDERHRVIHVRRGHLHRGGLADHALPDERDPSGVAGHQRVLLRDLDESAAVGARRAAHGGPQLPQPACIGGRRCFRENRDPAVDEVPYGLGRNLPGHRDDHELRSGAAQFVDGQEGGHPPLLPHLGGACRRARHHAGHRQPPGQSPRQPGEEPGPPATAHDAETYGCCVHVCAPPASGPRV
jgi:hypothetical protein